MTHVIGDRTTSPFVPLYAEQDDSVNSDPFLPFLQSLDENVRIHRERADSLKAQYDKQTAAGDSAQHHTWDTYTAQCDCLATAVERRREAWEQRKQKKAAKRSARIRANLLLAIVCGVVLCWCIF